MATEKRYQHNVIIIEPHGKIVGPKVNELRETILPKSKRSIFHGFSSTLSMPSDELLKPRCPDASLCDDQTQERADWGHPCR